MTAQDSETRSGWISKRLATAGPSVFSAYCIAAAFGTYFCMYAFRKPFTAATYSDVTWLGIGFKTILVSAQVSGYMVSKFIGVKVVSEMSGRYRALAILGLIGIAEISLLLFAITPAPWNCFWLFVNGLPLGMVFGLVIRFLEGRRLTEALSAGLCASFVMASGFVKSIGRTLLQDYDVDPYWMPFLTGLIFVVPLLICVWLLDQIPPPNAEDESLRSRRRPMTADDRRAFYKKHAVGLAALLTLYVFLTIVRSIRDDFAVEIWQEMGVGDKPKVFAKSEFWVMLGVVVINGLAVWLKNNRTAFLTSIGLLIVGYLVVLATVFGWQSAVLSPMSFMVLLGLGMYIPYVAFHTTVFERMLAAFGEAGTLGFLMCLADAVGYLGYIAVMIFRNTTTGEVGFLNLMIRVAVGVATVSSGISLWLIIYYAKRVPRDEELDAAEGAVSGAE